VGNRPARQKQETNMRSKNSSPSGARELPMNLGSARTTQIFGVALTAVFVTMLILNAISY
jgi:hypothetical protein